MRTDAEVWRFIKNKSERIPLEAVDRESQTEQQNIVFDLLKMASNHYRFLLTIICSNSFKVYFEMLKDLQMQHVLPVREQRDLYEEYLQGFRSSVAEDVKQIRDAEVEADEFDDDGSSKGVS